MGKIKLNRKTFKALAGETRVKILKSLKERKKYLAELSEELEMSDTSVKEHLETLMEADLIEREESERKWKYYRLTRKGKDLISKKETKAYILLGTSILTALIGLGVFLKNKVLSPVAARAAEEAASLTKAPGADSLNKSAELAGQSIENSSAQALNLNSVGLILMITGFIATILITIWIRRRD